MQVSSVLLKGGYCWLNCISMITKIQSQAAYNIIILKYSMYLKLITFLINLNLSFLLFIPQLPYAFCSHNCQLHCKIIIQETKKEK